MTIEKNTRQQFTIYGTDHVYNTREEFLKNKSIYKLKEYSITMQESWYFMCFYVYEEKIIL